MVDLRAVDSIYDEHGDHLAFDHVLSLMFEESVSLERLMLEFIARVSTYFASSVWSEERKSSHESLYSLLDPPSRSPRR